MKIAIIIDNKIGSGGGFDQALNSIIQFKKLCNNNHEIVVITLVKENVGILEDLGIASIFFKVSLRDKLLSQFCSNQIFLLIQKFLKYLGPLEKKLLSINVDLAYFVTPSSLGLAFQVLNFITTIWDICHRDHPEFPEVRNFGEFFRREYIYKNLLSYSSLVICDSKKTADNMSFQYGIDIRKLLPMPFSPSPLITLEKKTHYSNVLKKYHIFGEYYYYPAQFWPHKNHIRILEALSYLKEKKITNMKVVFSGRDYGNLALVRDAIRRFGLESQVVIIGFVNSDEVRALYHGAKGVLFPSYFGPTNLPPLEAWSESVPLVYPRDFKAYTGAAAEYIDPDDASSLAGAILKLRDKRRSNMLIRRGKERLEQMRIEREESERLLLKWIERYSNRNVNWRVEQ